MAVRLLTFFLALAVLCLAPSFASATNGDNLIGVGPISRAMGGVGIAAPQDAISAVFSNPASMCFGSFCPSDQVDFAGTLFMPVVKGAVTLGNTTFSANAEHRYYPIPALGISFSFPELPLWRFGFGAYGVSGLGVNYKGTPLDQPNFFAPGAPLAAGSFTDLMIMKFAPTAAYQPLDWLSVGVALNIDYSTLDLGAGNGTNFAVGAQIGAIAKATDKLSFGLTYTTPQRISYSKVVFGFGDLALSSPNVVGIGVAYEPLPKKFLIEANLKWLNWSGATGYSDFDWRDQIVANIGMQYKPIPKLALRVGYNFGNNPVKNHSNFNGNTITNVQGINIPNYFFETFRIIGFPAIVEHHLTVGIGYEVTPRFIVNLGFMHAFENTITETGTFGPAPVRIQSKLYENSIDAGFSIRF